MPLRRQQVRVPRIEATNLLEAISKDVSAAVADRRLDKSAGFDLLDALAGARRALYNSYAAPISR